MPDPNDVDPRDRIFTAMCAIENAIYLMNQELADKDAIEKAGRMGKQDRERVRDHLVDACLHIRHIYLMQENL